MTSIGADHPTRADNLLSEQDAIGVQSSHGRLPEKRNTKGFRPLNHQGMRAFVPEDAAVKIPVTTPEQIIRDFALAIDSLVSNPDSMHKMSEASFAFAKEQTWTRRAEMMNTLYSELVKGVATHLVG